MQHISEITKKIREELLSKRVEQLITEHDVDAMTTPELREKIKEARRLFE